MLQAGSFTQFSEADGLRARLALIGVEASIREVTVGNTVFHRVRVGPYRDYSDAARIQKILKHNRVESLLMKSGG
jgi:cell division protein FtsN